MSGGRVAGYALLGLAGLLFVVAVFSGWRGAQGILGREDDTRVVETAAREFVLAYGTFNHREPDAYAARLTTLTTGALREALAEAVIAPDARAMQRRISTHIEAVSVTALSETEATTAVTAVQERRWSDPVIGTAMSESMRQRVTCRLVREDRRWLVVELRLLSEEPAHREVR